MLQYVTYLSYLRAMRAPRNAPLARLGLPGGGGNGKMEANRKCRDRRTSRRTPSTITCRECIHRWLDRTRGSRALVCTLRGKGRRNYKLYQKRNCTTYTVPHATHDSDLYWIGGGDERLAAMPGRTVEDVRKSVGIDGVTRGILWETTCILWRNKKEEYQSHVQ